MHAREEGEGEEEESNIQVALVQGGLVVTSSSWACDVGFQVSCHAWHRQSKRRCTD